MSGNKIFLDTNIIVYFLNGDDTLTTFLDNKIIYISFITKLELLGYQSLNKNQETQIKNFLSECIVIGTNISIESEVIKIRKKHKIKLPDCIIMASAIHHDIPLITADRDFDKIKELNIIYYTRK